MLNNTVLSLAGLSLRYIIFYVIFLVLRKNLPRKKPPELKPNPIPNLTLSLTSHGGLFFRGIFSWHQFSLGNILNLRRISWTEWSREDNLIEIFCCKRTQRTHFSNHSKLIVFHIRILRGRRWFQWSESLFIIFSSSFHIIVSLILQQPFLCVLQKSYSSKCYKIYRKTSVLESIFNKIRLAILTKKIWHMCFIVNFSKLLLLLMIYFSLAYNK